jgi:hypothetical protein
MKEELEITWRVAYSREEINKLLTKWMINTFGRPLDIKDKDERNQWYEYNGVIHHFITCHFPDSEGKTDKE